MYTDISTHFLLIARSTGWGPTAIGYSMQGAAKYGFYEYFKKTYSDMAGPTNAKKYKDAIFLAGSASAEFLADMALVPVGSNTETSALEDGIYQVLTYSSHSSSIADGGHQGQNPDLNATIRFRRHGWSIQVPCHRRYRRSIQVSSFSMVPTNSLHHDEGQSFDLLKLRFD